MSNRSEEIQKEIEELDIPIQFRTGYNSFSEQSIRLIELEAELKGIQETEARIFEENKVMVGNMALVISALQDFKYKCYEQAGKGNIDTAWLMNNAPCNIDAIEILCDVLKRYYPEIYQYKGKSIRQMEEELTQKIKEKVG